LKVALKHQKSKINQSYSIVSRRKTAKTNHRMKPYSKCLQKGKDHDRKTLPLHDMQVSPGFEKGVPGEKKNAGVRTQKKGGTFRKKPCPPPPSSSMVGP
jgi:hypothetical protein